MKNAIKVLCFTLAFIIVGSSAAFFYLKWGKSDFDFVDGTEKGTVKITAYNGESKDVVIPSKIKGKKVTQIDTLAFEDSDITSIEIGKNVTYLGKSVFRGCQKLKSVKLGKSLISIDEGCFNDCTTLEEIVLPKTLQKLGGSIFSGCTSLKKVEIEDGSNFVIKDDVLFSADMKTLYFALPYADLGDYVCPDTVETVSPLAFYKIEKLNSFKFSGKIKTVPQGMFILCKNLKEIVVPDSVTKIGSAIMTSSGVKKITIPSSVTEIDKSAFVLTDGEIDKELVIKTVKGSKAETYAKANGIKIEY